MSRSIRKRSESRDILFGNHPSDLAQMFEGLDAVLRLYEKALDGEDRLIWWTERTLVSALTQAAMRRADSPPPKPLTGTCWHRVECQQFPFAGHQQAGVGGASCPSAAHDRRGSWRSTTRRT